MTVRDKKPETLEAAGEAAASFLMEDHPLVMPVQRLRADGTPDGPPLTTLRELLASRVSSDPEHDEAVALERRFARLETRLRGQRAFRTLQNREIWFHVQEIGRHLELLTRGLGRLVKEEEKKTP